MWGGKMAAQWRGKDGELNAGNRDVLSCNTPNEFTLCRNGMNGVEMDPQSCMDHSILAIFEDSTVSSEAKSGVEEESETLLSALTEMLDCVEDDARALSPFDTLPDTKLLTHQESKERLLSDVSITDNLRPRAKSPKLRFMMKSGARKESKTGRGRLFKQQSLLHSNNNKKVGHDVEIFTSTSLVNLVKIMHPYCLKLHVEEEEDGGCLQSTARPSPSSQDNLWKNHTLFSQEEVWRYEKPSGDCDEEINVVSDDEFPLKETKEEDDIQEKGKLLKSALLNGNSCRTPLPREKKRVSFGPVQVASFDESAQAETNEQNPTSGHTSGIAAHSATGLALNSPTAPSSETASGTSDDLPPKCEAKAKSLSLQQYRQLRQKRQPLVEKQGNYTTKWPSVPEAPKELTPILCLHGKRRNCCGPKTAHHYLDCPRNSTYLLHRPGDQTSPQHASLLPQPEPVEVKPSVQTPGCVLKCPRTESKTVSPAKLLADVTTANGSESKRSPVKKLTPLSSDPPNPVLLHLPATQRPQPSTVHSSSSSSAEFLNSDSSTESTRHLQEIQNGSPLSQTQPCSLEPQASQAHNPKSNRTQELQGKFTETASDLASTSPSQSQTKCNSEKPQNLKLLPKIQKSAKQVAVTCPPSVPNPGPPACLDTRIQVEKTLPDVPSSISPPEEPPPSLKLGSRGPSAAGESGIEAADLTSLLEQFEEKQAKEDGERESKNTPTFIGAALPSSLQAHGDSHRTAVTEPTSKPTETPSMNVSEPIRSLPDLQTFKSGEIPQPLGTEVILSTQEEPSARRKNAPSKAIQIIDPRPLPSRRANASSLESPASHCTAHMYSSVSSDHDYCMPADHSPTSGAQRYPSSLKDNAETTREVQATARNSSAEGGKQVSESKADRAADAKHGMRHQCDDHRSETNYSADTVLPFSDKAATDQPCSDKRDDAPAPCPLPTPPPSPPSRGRQKRRYCRRSPHSDSSSCSSSSSPSSTSSSGSRSPKRPRLHHKRSESSSWSSSSSRSASRSPPRWYRLSHSRSRHRRSRSRSWSRSRSRSQSPMSQSCRRRWRDIYSRRESKKLRREQETRIQKLKAIDERRVVYVGRIRRSMTHDELRERFSQFGDVECVSLHFREKGDHYGFVTFYNMEDAFAAIDNGGKLRRPDELPFDICFGGRRQFCNSDYADLDASRGAEPSPARSRFEELDFDSLLKQAQRGLKR